VAEAGVVVGVGVGVEHEPGFDTWYHTSARIASRTPWYQAQFQTEIWDWLVTHFSRCSVIGMQSVVLMPHSSRE
jgi:hypothetical protein